MDALTQYRVGGRKRQTRRTRQVTRVKPLLRVNFNPVARRQKKGVFYHKTQQPTRTEHGWVRRRHSTHTNTHMHIHIHKINLSSQKKKNGTKKLSRGSLRTHGCRSLGRRLILVTPASAFLHRIHHGAATPVAVAARTALLFPAAVPAPTLERSLVTVAAAAAASPATRGCGVYDGADARRVAQEFRVDVPCFPEQRARQNKETRHKR